MLKWPNIVLVAEEVVESIIISTGVGGVNCGRIATQQLPIVNREVETTA